MVVRIIRVFFCMGCTLRSSDSFAFAWVHSDVPSGGLVSGVFTPARLGVLRFIRARAVARPALFHSGATSGRRVYSRSRGFTRSHLAVVGFFRDYMCLLGRTLGSSGSLVFSWVHSTVPRSGRFYSGSRGFTWEVVGSFRSA